MIPVITELLTLTENPFNPEPLTENPIITELNMIGQVGSQDVVGGTHTQSIIEGRKDIIHGNFITHIITNPRQISLKGDYFPFDKEQAQTLMLTSLLESMLARNRNIGTTSILGALRTNQSRIFAPGMHEDVSGRYDVRSTVRNDVREADKLDTTVDGPTTNEQNTESLRIVECTPKSILREEIKEFDSSSQMNLANYVPVKTPDLVSFRDPTINTDNVLDRRSVGVAANSLRVQTPDLVPFRDPTIHTDNILDQRSGGVATRIADKDRIWDPKPSYIGTAATHDEIKNISEKLAFSKYIKDLDYETIKM